MIARFSSFRRCRTASARVIRQPSTCVIGSEHEAIPLWVTSSAALDDQPDPSFYEYRPFCPHAAEIVFRSALRICDRLRLLYLIQDDGVALLKMGR